MAYTALVPKISAAILIPNPTNINAKITLQITAFEEETVVYASYYSCGDIYAGEV